MDCIFSVIEEQLSLPSENAGGLWYFASSELRLNFHHHRELELNLVTRGHAVYLLDDRRYMLTPGTLVWLFPAQNHILLDRSADFAMWILVIRPSLVDHLCTEEQNRVLCVDNPTGSYCRRLSRESSNRLHTLFQEVAEVEEHAHFNAGLAYAFLSAWKAYLIATREETACRVHPAIEATARLFREDAEPSSLKQMALRFGLSESRLSTLFKEQTGIPLTRYRNQQRLERFFRSYEQNPVAHKTLLEVALEAGFGSYAQFYRVFCATMGCPPTEYRGNQRLPP